MVIVRFKGRFGCRFRCELIIHRCLPVHNPRGSGSCYRFKIYDLKNLSRSCGAAYSAREMQSVFRTGPVMCEMVSV